jgi:hypothetical protein
MTVDLTGGLNPSREDVFTEAPRDPDCREGVNIWLQDDDGRFAFPRMGVEAVSRSWARRGIVANIAFPDGRVLIGSCEGDAIGPYDEEGRPAVIGAGPIQFHCVQPFERWTMSYRGAAVDTTIDQQLAGVPWPEARVEVAIDVDMTMVVPPWLRGQMSDPARKALEGTEEALFIGGENHKQLFRATGVFEVGERAMPFTASGLRVHRQGIRDTAEMRGHCWQSAVFPSGRAFDAMVFPDHPDGSPAYNEAFVFDGERRWLAEVVKAPWMTSFVPHGGDVSLILNCEIGTVTIRGETHSSTVMPGSAQVNEVAAMRRSSGRQHDLFFHQGSALYTWDDESAFGMVERSLPRDQVAY